MGYSRGPMLGYRPLRWYEVVILGVAFLIGIPVLGAFSF